MRFWWVNHNKTWRQEIGDGYLWSPRREAKARSQFYDNMRIATRGDLVLSYASKRVGHIGVVTDDAIGAPKPAKFGASGAYWANEGWMLPVAWQPATSPAPLSAIYNDLKPLLPLKYSPIDRNGEGAQKAYFSELSADAFELVHQRIGVAELPSLADKPPQFDVIRSELERQAETEVAADETIDRTERDQIIRARRGQGVFRDRVSKLETSCRLTGVKTPELLIASHIKPWRSCESAAERLDGANGLMLTPTIDRLFDRGFISFKDDGAPIFSSRLLEDVVKRLRLSEGLETPRAFTDGQKVYLDHHRTVSFLG